MLDIVFSHSYYYKFDVKQWNNKTPYPPLGTLYAASYLRENGYEVGVFDANLLDDPTTIQPYLEKQRPKTFVLYDDGFNYLTKMCLTTMREAAFEMIKIAKKLKDRRYHQRVIKNKKAYDRKKKNKNSYGDS